MHSSYTYTHPLPHTPTTLPHTPTTLPHTPTTLPHTPTTLPHSIHDPVPTVCTEWNFGIPSSTTTSERRQVKTKKG